MLMLILILISLRTKGVYIEKILFTYPAAANLQSKQYCRINKPSVIIQITSLAYCYVCQICCSEDYLVFSHISFHFSPTFFFTLKKKMSAEYCPN